MQTKLFKELLLIISGKDINFFKKINEELGLDDKSLTYGGNNPQNFIQDYYKYINGKLTLTETLKLLDKFADSNEKYKPYFYCLKYVVFLEFFKEKKCDFVDIFRDNILLKKENKESIKFLPDKVEEIRKEFINNFNVFIRELITKEAYLNELKNQCEEGNYFIKEIPKKVYADLSNFFGSEDKVKNTACKIIKDLLKLDKSYCEENILLYFMFYGLNCYFLEIYKIKIVIKYLSELKEKLIQIKKLFGGANTQIKKDELVNYRSGFNMLMNDNLELLKGLSVFRDNGTALDFNNENIEFEIQEIFVNLSEFLKAFFDPTETFNVLKIESVMKKLNETCLFVIRKKNELVKIDYELFLSEKSKYDSLIEEIVIDNHNIFSGLYHDLERKISKITIGTYSFLMETFGKETELLKAVQKATNTLFPYGISH